MICRDMEERDLLEIVAIEEENFSQPWTREDFLHSIKKDSDIYLVIEENNEILGYCGLWGVAGEGQINNVAVKKSYQSKGIGLYMMSQLISTGKSQGLQAFTLEVRESNEKAIALYQKLNFEICGIRRGFYDKPKENALIMWLR